MGSSNTGGLLDAIDDPIFVVVGDAIEFVNEAAARFLGAPRDEVVGTVIDSWLTGGVTIGAVRRLQSSRAVLEFRCSDDDVVGLRVEAPREVEYEGRPGLMLIGVEWGLRARELLDRLVVMNRLTTLGALVAGIGRELHTYLGAVSDNLDELGTRVADRLGPAEDPDGELGELLGATASGAEQLRHLADEVGTLAGDETDVQLVEVGALVRTSLRLVRASVGERATFVERYIPGLPLVWANPVRLSQVVLNLVLSAVRSLPESSSPATSSIVVEVGVDGGGDPLLAISDTGEGLSEASLDALLRASVPPAMTVGTEAELGLFLSRQIVRDLRGQIELDTEQGRGTTMFVTLPAADLARRATPRVH